MALPTLRVAIVGGGLGGLAAALFLRQVGLEALVYEQAPALREVGAGLVITPNMVRPLAQLGLAQHLPDFAVKLEAAWEFRRWQDGRVLFSQPLGQACERLYGAACWVAHRADLLALLQGALPAEQLHLDHRLVRLTQDTHQVHLRFVQRDGSTVDATADVVIGADGIHSAVGQALHGDAGTQAPRFSGLCAWRFLVPANQAPAFARQPVQTLWLGPGRHVVHYPISGGRFVNVVGILPAGDWRRESWTAVGELAELRSGLLGWDGRLQDLLNAAPSALRWAMFDRDPLPGWTHGRVTLLGDAAHPMLPFFAQGAAQAIEDAQVLAECLRGVDAGTVSAALLRYEQARLPRTGQVQRASRGREIRNHLPDGAEQQQRDAEFRQADPLAQSAWLYGHDALSTLGP